ncbi:MAG TPA: aminotransferase class V-fold PLP-dependent enzyme [Mobilitalea sp.]|nr:aminotransferase class V-fold PLP-dependent enzyme [Mobilitalea sp.]
MNDNKYTSPILEKIRNSSYEKELALAHELACDYIKNTDNMPVYPSSEALADLSVFDTGLPTAPVETSQLLHLLGSYGAKATVAQTGGRYFGFVNGGILPAALCTKWLSDTWDQNAAMYVTSPIASKLEEVCERWLVGLLGFPKETVVGFVSGSSTASLCGLLAGRNYLLDKLGYDVTRNGLFSAPEIKVVLGEGAHSTIYKALSILGLGHERLIKVPADEQGRIRVDQLPKLDSRTLLILQAGNVNSGAFDDFDTILPMAKEAGAWVHVDGAFGLWAAANKKMESLTSGLSLADSWSLDAHKTLNAPYDNGIILCRHKNALVNSLHMTGSYIIYHENRDSMLYTPEMSRRARAIELWASFMTLGSDGIAELVEELHWKAVYFAKLLREHEFEIMNEVVFNQVLVRFQDDSTTEELIRRVQASGVCWFGGSKWHGKSVIRISISSYKTTYEDIELSVGEIVKQTKKISEEMNS